MKEIILASHNNGKLKEFSQLLNTLNINVQNQKALNIDAIEETGLSFIENALLKARHASKHSGLPALADDSGIIVDALKGAPGIYSARFSGDNATAEENNRLLLEKLNTITEDKRSARFHCTLVFMCHAEDPSPLIAQANWEGMILTETKGQQGFGYDPLFWVPTHHCSAAELDPEEKNTISHRGKAAHILVKQLAELIKGTSDQP